MGCWHYNSDDRWQRKMDRMQRGFDRMQDGINRAQAAAERFRGYFQQPNRDYRPGYQSAGPSSGNHAFDEYRSETLQRLEEEQREFKEFLQRLRFAKDRAEFDQFMAERRKGASDQGPQPQAS